VEILNLGGAAEENSAAPKSRKKFRVILGIGALAAVTGIGSTLAANISLNGGGNVEFGQGVATTAACDNDITLTPISTFSNTEEDATFAMTAIQVSGIDLTPEGWDVDNEAWVSGYDWQTGTWNAENASHAGQYKNMDGVWTNTCANKSLMVRAYTDQSDYANRTADYSTSSPLLLNGSNYQRPNLDTVGGYNSGVGFRLEMPGINQNDYSNYYWDIADCDFDCQVDPTYVNIYFDGEYWNENSTVTIGLDDNNYFPPLDSRWVDKLTIESSATTPNGWNSDN
jgi:hypothetical protein